MENWYQRGDKSAFRYVELVNSGISLQTFSSKEVEMQNYNLGKIRGHDVTWGDTSLVDLEKACGGRRSTRRKHRDLPLSGLCWGRGSARLVPAVGLC